MQLSLIWLCLFVALLPTAGWLKDVMEEWVTCQNSWLYLEPIFSSDDINRQLPVEAKRYQSMERMWRKIMKSAFENRQVGMLIHRSGPGI